MATNDDLFLGTVGQSVGGQEMGLVLQQLKIITLILKEGFSITDDDFTMLAAPATTLNPATASNPNFTSPL